MTSGKTLTINRAPVLTLWAAAVAERLGFDRAEALTLGRAVAGLNAHSKGVSLGLYQPRPKEIGRGKASGARGEVLHIDLLHRAVPARRTKEGLRALSKDTPIAPESVHRYLQSRFGAALDDAREAMTLLAESFSPEELEGRAYSLYEAFRPAVPTGQRGWGAAGRLDLGKVRMLATR